MSSFIIKYSHYFLALIHEQTHRGKANLMAGSSHERFVHSLCVRMSYQIFSGIVKGGVGGGNCLYTAPLITQRTCELTVCTSAYSDQKCWQ